MSRLPVRRLAVLLVLPLTLVIALPVTAAVAQSPSSAPPEGPLPARLVLGANPATVKAPTVAAVSAPRACSAAAYGVNSYAPGSGKTVALTFDDGPGATTSAILSILEQYGLPATFFNIGTNQATRPTLVRSEATLGLVLGNHTWDHPQMSTLSAAAQASEMDKTSAEQLSLVGRPPCMFRPPYGEYNSTTLTLAQQRHMAVWNWSVDTQDWMAGSSTSSYWVNRIVSLAESEGAALQHPVILMHNTPAGVPATVLALPRIISFFAARGYRFATLAGTAGDGFPGPAATVTVGGVHLFGRAPSGVLTEITQASGGSWSGSAALGGSLVGGPAALALTSTTAAAFVAGTDNRVYEETIGDAGGPSGWWSIGGLATSRPAATIGSDGVVTVAVRGTDSGAWIRQETAGTWGGWQPLGGVLNTGLAVAATPGGLAVAGAGTDNALWVRVRTGATWSGWHPIGGVITADPALTATPSGGLLAVVRGSTNQAYVSVGNASGTAWTNWVSIGGVLASAPTVTIVGSTAEVFVVGTTGHVYENLASDASTGTGWSGWRSLP